MALSLPALIISVTKTIVMEQETTTQPKELGALLLEIGVSLLASGASCSRIRITVARFASAYSFAPHTTIGPKSVTITLNDEDGLAIFSGSRSIPAQGVDFKIISGISRLSWNVVEKKLSLHQISYELDRLRSVKYYPRLVTLLFVSIAGAAFCFTFGGNIPEMVITFGATFCGLFARQEMAKQKFNPYICTYAGALVASLFAGAFIKAGVNLRLEHAFATSVLFLIPGVPLINSFTDLIDGNTMNGMVRGVNALLFALAIAFGLLTTLLVYNMNG